MSLTPTLTLADGRLRDELRSLRGTAQDVAAACLLAADELETAGTPPNEETLDACASLLRRMNMVSETIRGELALTGEDTAASLPDPFADLPTLDKALDDLEAIVAHRRRIEDAVDAAREIAAFADHIQHADDPQFAPLATVNAASTALRNALDVPHSRAVPAAAIDVWNDTHPLMALLLLLANPEGLDDARWTALQETVTEAFGRSMATAVARGRILIPETVRDEFLRALEHRVST
ncbi:MAG: hypothetical protein IT428_19955 [Planctomycetaceae bacterium]|nr:hypothetical protein [Planctomycetaceae bacterium]